MKVLFVIFMHLISRSTYYYSLTDIMKYILQSSTQEPSRPPFIFYDGVYYMVFSTVVNNVNNNQNLNFKSIYDVGNNNINNNNDLGNLLY